MRTLKSLSRRGLALLLTLVMCTGMVNLSAFASDGEQDWDENFQLPNPQEVAMMMEELDPEAEDYAAGDAGNAPVPHAGQRSAGHGRPRL